MTMPPALRVVTSKHTNRGKHTDGQTDITERQGSLPEVEEHTASKGIRKVSVVVHKVGVPAAERGG